MAGEPFQVVYRHRSGAVHTVDGLRSAWEADVIRDALSIKEALDAGEDLKRLELGDGSASPWPSLVTEAPCSLAAESLPFAHLVQQLQRCVDRTRQESEMHGERRDRAFTLLHGAVACQHKEAALLLLAAAPIMAWRRDRHGRTVLHAVAELGWADVVPPLMMVASGAATTRDDSGAIPLAVAHARRQLEAARALMSTTLRSPLVGEVMGSMLMDSVENRSTRELAALLWIAAATEGVSGASLLDGLLTDMGPLLLRTALGSHDWCASRLLLEAAPWLVRHGHSRGQTVLHQVAAARHVYVHDSWRMRAACQLAEVLLAMPGTATALDSQGRTALFIATHTARGADSYSHSPDLLKVLAAAAPATVALPAATGETPVHVAITASEFVLQALLEAAPAQVVATLTAGTGPRTPLQLAVKKRRWEAVAKLLEVLMQASRSDGPDSRAAAWQLLLGAAHGPAALAQLVDVQGRTLLHAAAGRPTASVLQLLLSNNGGNVLVCTNVGRMPLHEAAFSGRADAVRLLLEAAPASATVRDARRDLPLHLAAMSGNTDTVRLLIEAAPHAATNSENLSGRLPLHWAALLNEPQVVKLLLEAAPATVGVKTRCGWSALELALLDQHADAAEILLRHGSTEDGLKALGAQAPPSLHHLYAALVASKLPLSATEWALVPSPCPRLGRALPPALQHSTEQARQLVRRLPAPDAERLRVAALALGGAQRQLRVHLHGSLVGRILSFVLA